MKYTTSNIRRQDRLLDEGQALHLLKNSEYGVLSVQAENGGAYAVPVNYAWDGGSSLYIHCAPEGRKLRCIDACNRVSFCVVGRTKILPAKFSTEYESIVLSCTAIRNLQADERMKALMLLLEKYSPGEMESGRKYAEKSFDRTEVIRLDISEWSGKSKKIL